MATVMHSLAAGLGVAKPSSRCFFYFNIHRAHLGAVRIFWVVVDYANLTTRLTPAGASQVLSLSRFCDSFGL
jgi:hypothetical protein